MESVAEQRAAFVAAAETWLRTPYRDCAMVKGAGTDCLGLIAGAAKEARLIGNIKLPKYRPDQNLHWSDRSKPPVETYLEALDPYCAEVPGPPERDPIPGDLIIWKFGWIFFHTAIVVRWPLIIHAYKQADFVDYEDVSKSAHLNFIGENTDERGKPRPRKFLIPRTWTECEPKFWSALEGRG